MNPAILHTDVQAYIRSNLHADVHQIAMGKSPFPDVTARELATQISARKKSEKKLPTWFHQVGIYFPEPLSIEQTSSEITAKHKATLVSRGRLIDLTGGFGVDSYYFAQQATQVVHCELNEDLSRIAAHNAQILGVNNIRFTEGDGLAYLRSSGETFDTIYIDPARRSTAGKVFMLKDCLPNVVENAELLLAHSKRVIIKTSPLLDITAGLRELNHVAEVHIISTRNECKELLFIIERDAAGPVKIVSTSLNEAVKEFSFYQDESATVNIAQTLGTYLYEPDVSLMKSGGFNLIGPRYGLEKLHDQTQLYTSNEFVEKFPGRIFRVDEIINASELKKRRNLEANVIVRNYPGTAEQLTKKYKIKPTQGQFLIFSSSHTMGLVVVLAHIEQYY